MTDHAVASVLDWGQQVIRRPRCRPQGGWWVTRASWPTSQREGVAGWMCGINTRHASFGQRAGNSTTIETYVLWEMHAVLYFFPRRTFIQCKRHLRHRLENIVTTMFSEHRAKPHTHNWCFLSIWSVCIRNLKQAVFVLDKQFPKQMRKKHISFHKSYYFIGSISWH